VPTHLTLLSAAATATVRTGGFPAAGEPLDEGGQAKARRRTIARAPDRMVRSPARAAEETAIAMGLEVPIEPRIGDMDFGRWAGRSFPEVPADELGSWLSAPEAGAPGGETMEQVRARVRPWLAEMAGEGLAVLAITHPMTIRAILAEALGLPDGAAMRIDIAPLSAAILSCRGTWRLQQLCGD
jgi:broad specificity phosphatase PhoE